jgi:nitrogen fixation NifU-like protein
MSELRDLYQEVILDHCKHPKNFRKLEDANRSAEGFNPLCGDQITLYLKVEEGLIVDIAFKGAGCAISKASASMMTAALKGKSVEEAERIFESFHHMVTTEPDEEYESDGLGKLEVFSGVREFPVRVKCASLAWHTLCSALKNNDDRVSTE